MLQRARGRIYRGQRALRQLTVKTEGFKDTVYISRLGLGGSLAIACNPLRDALYRLPAGPPPASLMAAWAEPASQRNLLMSIIVVLETLAQAIGILHRA